MIQLKSQVLVLSGIFFGKASDLRREGCYTGTFILKGLKPLLNFNEFFAVSNILYGIEPVIEVKCSARSDELDQCRLIGNTMASRILSRQSV